jgi:hypothetical protein
MQPLQPSSRQTLLGESQWPICNVMGVRIMRGMSAVSCAFKRRMQDPFSTRF